MTGGGNDAGTADRSIYSSWSLVALLTAISVLNYFDRQLPVIAVESMKADLALSDSAIGFINGLGFLVVYAVLGLPISRFADRGLHGPVLTACIALWSVMTAVGGLVTSGWQLALARMGVAAGEAGGTPTAHAIVAERFAVERRGTPLAVISTAAPIGAMLGLILGGILNDTIGWRATFLVMLVPGGLLALLAYWALPRASIPRPTHAPSTMIADCRALFRVPSFVRLILAAATMATGTAAQVAFSPAFLIRAHGLSATEVGLKFGLLKGCLGIAGLVAGGFLIDRLSRRDMRWIVWLPALAVTMALPFSLSAWFIDDADLAITFVSIINAAGLFYLAPVFSAVQVLSPAHLRALASAVTLAAISIISGLGPLLVGIISDALRPHLGADALGRGMLLVPAMHAAGAVLFVALANPFKKAASGVAR